MDRVSRRRRTTGATRSRRLSVPVSLLELAVESANDGIVITDARQRDNPVIYVNPAFEKMTGFSSAEAIGHNCRFLQGGQPRQAGLSDLRRSLRKRAGCVVRLRNFRKDGRPFWNELSIAPVLDRAGRPTHFVGIQKDVTAQVNAVEQIVRYQRKLLSANRRLKALSVHDPLTGLFNRRHFAATLDREWLRAARDHKPLAVVIFDIDFFKQFNDTCGHLQGDVALKSVAGAIQGALRRPADHAARYGGEEMVVLAPGLRLGQAAILAETIRDSIRELRIEHRASRASRYLSVSAGVACMVPSKDVRAETLLHRADMALYHAKRTGRNRTVVATSGKARDGNSGSVAFRQAGKRRKET